MNELHDQLDSVWWITTYAGERKVYHIHMVDDVIAYGCHIYIYARDFISTKNMVKLRNKSELNVTL